MSVLTLRSKIKSTLGFLMNSATCEQCNITWPNPHLCTGQPCRRN